MTATGAPGASGRWRIAGQAVLLAALAALGLAVALRANGYVVQLLFNTALYVLLATGWNVIGGMTGYVSFGQVGFFGLGAYAAAIAVLNLDLSWPVAALLAVAAATCLAVPLGLVMLRLNGIFFALGMFGLARILQIAANSLDITGGPMGTSVPAATSPVLPAVVTVLLAAAAVACVAVLMRSRLGLRLMAVRDDAVAAEAAGVNVWRAKVIAFCIGAGLAAVGGALYVWNVGYLDPGSAFTGTIELQTVLMVLAGGIGTVWGPVVGGILVSLLATALWARFPMEQQIVLGALTILIAVALPGGLMSLLRRTGWAARTPIWGPPVRSPVAAPDGPPRHRAPEGAVLTCRGLGKRFGGVVAVDGIDLQVRPGEVLAVIGPNGAGKSTLFNLLSGFARPSSGRVDFAGRPLGGMKPYMLARSGIARTFQTSRLFPTLGMGNGAAGGDRAAPAQGRCGGRDDTHPVRHGIAGGLGTAAGRAAAGPAAAAGDRARARARTARAAAGRGDGRHDDA
ncbi:MAG TPA: ATP-binding cassette domain-containing protein [Acetobacteraceae bacterium]|nr:ATP-binding cassette domain-containing protein [Acetobacteraceae bacterium]